MRKSVSGSNISQITRKKDGSKSRSKHCKRPSTSMLATIKNGALIKNKIPIPKSYSKRQGTKSKSNVHLSKFEDNSNIS